MPAQRSPLGPLVVKAGGHAAVDPDAVCADVAAVARTGRPTVLVHGGSADIDRLGARLGVPARRLTALDGIITRHTDAATLEVVQLALGGLVRPRLVARLHAHGVRAVGLSGVDGGLLRARRKAAHRAWEDGRRVVVRDVHSGRITGVDAGLLHTLLAAGVLPVVGPPALAEDGRPVNADADRVAAAVAGAVGAGTLVLLTGAPGVLADPADEASVLAACAVPAAGPPPYRGGGMGLKLVAAREALAAGVPEVLVADGRRDRPLSRALAGAATRIELAADEGGPG
ncbi:N-acetylglutamate kinase [Thermomonospora echinospora]|uniref:N-acetylglutamate kinase n=1 Tax=Thermomonospora echinospora TaxID=1992 RepID=A0A1H6DZ82_9ACTN|nr:[LysW]-aminoadipate kinase [Thermomonospora echinospora]SEG90076.1 N-acetylglutamate kinase [Thermomonospora echinospora]